MSRLPSCAAPNRELFEKIPPKKPLGFLLAMKFAAAIWIKVSAKRDTNGNWHLVDEECDQRRAGKNKLMTNGGETRECKQTHGSAFCTCIKGVKFFANDGNVHRRQRAALALVKQAQRFAQDVTHSRGTNCENRGYTLTFEIFSLAAHMTNSGFRKNCTQRITPKPRSVKLT
jgi:hypothetical protein